MIDIDITALGISDITNILTRWGEFRQRKLNTITKIT